MSKIIRNTIRTNLTGAFSIEGNRDLFEMIVADQEKFAGKLRPARNWDLAIGGHEGQRYFYSQNSEEPIELETNTNEIYENFSSLQKMMDPFVGCTGLKSINRDAVQGYFNYLERIDHLNILPNYFDADGELKDQANDLIVTDLGSILDINIITSFLDPTLEKYHILEVGGGYGRLAEAFLNMHEKGNIKYVLVDAVPASLMYSYLYLSNKFHDLRIGFYYHDDPFDMDLFDCYIMPAWHFDISTNRATFDCCINIQSMQEMNQYHVDYYLNMFDKIIKDGSGIIYISNEKDYIFQGKWNYPVNWRCLLRTRTPRSWTRNSPTEVFIKGIRSYRSENCAVDSLYSLQLEQFDENLENETLISNLQLELQRSQREISILRTKALFKPLVSEEPTVEKVEERIRGINKYYSSKELPDMDRLFQNISKISAHLLAINLYLRNGRYRDAVSHMVVAGKLDPFLFFSIQVFRIIGNGLLYRLRRN
jgi:SAM-dependent methyltransferase